MLKNKRILTSVKRGQLNGMSTMKMVLCYYNSIALLVIILHYCFGNIWNNVLCVYYVYVFFYISDVQLLLFGWFDNLDF